VWSVTMSGISDVSVVPLLLVSLEGRAAFEILGRIATGRNTSDAIAASKPGHRTRLGSPVQMCHRPVASTPLGCRQKTFQYPALCAEPEMTQVPAWLILAYATVPDARQRSGNRVWVCRFSIRGRLPGRFSHGRHLATRSMR
jgi:hypothetical protein